MSFFPLAPLPSSPNLHEGETFRSWISRVARSHFVPDAVEFLPMVGLPARAANQPTWDDLVEIGRITGTDPEALIGRTVIEATRTTPDKVLARGILVEAKSGVPFRLCPACVAGDMAPDEATEPRWATWERLLWLAEDYDLCHIHRVPMIETANAPGFQTAVDGLPFKLLPLEPVMGHEHGLGEFLSRSLKGVISSASALDGLALRATFRTCLTIGALDRYGSVECQPEELVEKWSVADCGFAVISKGNDAVEKLLDRIIRRSGGKDLRSAFGKSLLHKLSVAGRERRLRFLREQFVAAAYRNRLYGKSVKTLLGLNVPLAEGWTVHELAEHFGKSQSVIKDILAGLGHDANNWEHAPLPNEIVTELEPFRYSVTRHQAAVHLGISEKPLAELVNGGVLSPLISKSSSDGKSLEQYGIEDIDRARDAVFRHCQGAFVSGDAVFSAAGGLVGRSTGTVLSMLVGGPCAWANLPQGATKIGEIQVHVAMLRKAVRGDEGPLGVQSAADILRVDRKTVMSLVKAGAFSGQTCTNPVNLRQQLCIDRRELQRFADDHVSSKALSDNAQYRAWRINRYLDHLGVAHIGAGTRFYAWKDLENATTSDRDGVPQALWEAAVTFHIPK